MSRPLVPVFTPPGYAVRTWATNTNYPAGAEPWAGTPTKTEPAGPAGGFVPGTVATPSEFNKLFSDSYLQDAAAKTFVDGHTTEVQSAFTNAWTYVGQAMALNHLPLVGSIGTLVAAAYDRTNRKWWIVGDTENVRHSDTQGQTWTVNAPIAAAGANENCRGLDVDTAGNLVVSTNTAFVFTLTTANVAAKVSVFAGNAARFDVAYSPTANLWCASVTDGIGTSIKTSPDRATWTLRTATTGWDDFTTYETLINVRLAANKTSGRLVQIGQGAAGIGPSGDGKFRVATSDDGGITWTDRGLYTVAFTGGTDNYLSHNADKPGEWYYVIGKTGSNLCEVWKSTDDGASWAQVKALTTVCLGTIAALGELLVSTSRVSGETVLSVDGGATWKFAGFKASGSSLGAFAGEGCAMLVSSVGVYPPIRFGMPSQTVA